ncbi:MAG: F0F1 ATP synthase subunit A [Candidatus Omnitrophica bacterium]|nr:F0F1 ATP synthase subunit A [Candidatus Omnitrophota bacterium]
MQVEDAVNQVHAAAHTAPHEVHELPNFITLLNQYFPDAPWAHFLHQWENIIFSALAATLVVSVGLIAASKNHLIPEGVRNFAEAVVEGVEGFVTGILGERGKEHVPFLGTIFLYILIMNWTGLIPLMKSPTSGWSITIAVALATTVYVQFTGICKQGPVHYLKHMAGNPSNIFGIVLIPLMLVINMTVEFLAVPLSLSLRLFANVSSEDRLLFKFAELNILFKGLPFLFQLFANILAIAFSVVQAFVFMLLSTVYISLILPHEDHHEEHTHAPEKHLAHAH